MIKRYRSIGVVLCIFGFGLYSAQATEFFDKSLVTIESGKLQGTFQDGIHIFKGIPYAQPPVGNLRWQAPAPPKSWDEVRPAQKYGASCMQNSAGKDEINVTVPKLQSEDCLTLNIWSPANAETSRLPVMVWIHGGWFSRGSSSQYPGYNLAKQGGVVVVTFNYRLGLFGFLALPALTGESKNHSSGNYGLLDQIAALRWVKDNIGAFGGDPSRITIFGQSAGAFSVCDLLVSPPARGLFARAIMQSGRCDARLPLLAAEEKRGERIAAKAGCNGPGDLVACLRKQSAQELMAQVTSATSYVTTGFYFYPNQDGYVLPGAPRALIDQGSFARVPVMLGTVAQEASRFLPEIRSGSDWQAFAKRMWGERADKVMSLYSVAGDAQAFAVADEAMTDSRYGCPTWEAAISLQAHGVPVYLYSFTHAPYSGNKRRLGAYHAVENGYIFGNLHATADRTVGPADYALSVQLAQYWSRFAAAGNPNSPQLPTWPEFSSENPKLQRLDTVINTGPYPKAAICQRWAAITRP